MYNKDLLARLVGHKGSWRQETLASQFPTWDGSGCTTRICLRTLSAQWTARPGGWGACRCLGVCFFFFLPVTLAERRASGSRSAKGAEGETRHASTHTSCSGQAPSLCIGKRSLAVQRGAGGGQQGCPQGCATEVAHLGVAVVYNKDLHSRTIKPCRPQWLLESVRGARR